MNVKPSPVVWLMILLLATLVPMAVPAQPVVPVAPAAADADPRTVVSTLESALIASMKAGTHLDLGQRKAALAPVVERSLDVPRMARFIFGTRWRTLSEADRERFIATFSELSVATYADRFDQHKGERFDPVSETAQGDSRMLVRSRFTKGSGDTVAFDYLLMRGDDGWRVVNILTDGISDLALKRSQYGALYDRDGMNAVIARIREQIDDDNGG